MSPLTLSMRHLPSKGLIFSILLHSLFLTTFVIVFPPLDESFKPEFLFLGSILKNQDLKGTVAQIGPTDSWQIPQIAAPLNDVLLPNKTLSIPQINKPSQSLPTKQEKKLLTNSMIGETSDQTPRKRPVMDEHNFDLHLTPYKPLKLETK